jgi:hypothetical protein
VVLIAAGGKGLAAGATAAVVSVGLVLPLGAAAMVGGGGDDVSGGKSAAAVACLRRFETVERRGPAFAKCRRSGGVAGAGVTCVWLCGRMCGFLFAVFQSVSRCFTE